MASLLGIEIGEGAVRGALVRTGFRKVLIARYAEVPILPPAELAMGEDGQAIVHEDPTRGAVQELMRLSSPPTPATIVALPGDEASIRRIDLPAAAIKKIDELLPIEMEAVVPFDPEVTMLDHQVIGVDGGLARVLVAAVPKERVRERLGVWQSLGLEPQELAVGAASLEGLARLVPVLAEPGPHVVLHLSARRTEVCILVNGRAELARTISIGATELAEASRAASSAYGGGGRAAAAAERLGRELRQTLAAWRMQGGAVPAGLHLSGEGLHDGVAVAWVSEVLAQPAAILDLPDATPPSNLDVPTRARFAIALGLAARAMGKDKRIDLRKGEFVARRTTGLVRQHAGLFAACGAALVTSFLFSTYAQWSVLDNRRLALETELESVTRDRLGQATTSPTQARSLLESGGRRNDPLPRFTAYDAMAAISAAIPADIEHDVQRLHVDLGDDRSGGHFELAGVVSSIEEIDRISQALGDNPCFREIERGPVTQAHDSRRSYRIEADILCPGDEAPETGRRRGRGGASATKTGGGR